MIQFLHKTSNISKTSDTPPKSPVYRAWGGSQKTTYSEKSIKL